MAKNACMPIGDKAFGAAIATRRIWLLFRMDLSALAREKRNRR